MQKAIIARPPKAFGQNVLQQQFQKRYASQSAGFHFPGSAVLVLIRDLAVLVGHDVFFGQLSIAE